MPAGTIGNPMSDRAIENKFFANAAPVVGAERARQIAATVWKLDTLADVRDARSSFALDAASAGGSASMPADKRRPRRAIARMTVDRTCHDEICRCCDRVALIVAGTAPALAQFKPTKPIEIVVHNGPGSGPDIFGRTVAQSDRAGEARAGALPGRRTRSAAAASRPRTTWSSKQGRRPYARRLHQRVDDQPAGAEGGRHQGRRHDADRAAGGRAGGDRGAAPIRRYKIAARRDGRGAEGSRQDQAGGRLAARARRLVRSC